jgi:L-fucose mutarotase
VLRFPLIHPPLLAALGAAGHGGVARGRVLLADANYSHSTNVSPAATVIHLNLRPGQPHRRLPSPRPASISPICNSSY